LEKHGPKLDNPPRRAAGLQKNNPRRKRLPPSVGSPRRAESRLRRKFGYVFLICATGKSSEEILNALRQRLPNDPDAELRIAAEEQRKITRLRLEKFLEP